MRKRVIEEERKDADTEIKQKWAFKNENVFYLEVSE